jgi:hypothetical protein
MCSLSVTTCVHVAAERDHLRYSHHMMYDDMRYSDDIMY